jgi:hypothetical protein
VRARTGARLCDRLAVARRLGRAAFRVRLRLPAIPYLHHRAIALEALLCGRTSTRRASGGTMRRTTSKAGAR